MAIMPNPGTIAYNGSIIYYRCIIYQRIFHKKSESTNTQDKILRIYPLFLCVLLLNSYFVTILNLTAFKILKNCHLKQRYYSLDVFRGATVALMILVNNPGSGDYVYAPLDHAKWHGCTPTDLVFPFFLFAVGNAMAFVMPRLQQAGTPAFLAKVFRRAP